VCFLLSRAGTRIGQASECFVYWKDPVTNDTWGLNFTSPADARAFRECCVSFPCLLIVVNDHQLGGFEYPALLGGAFSNIPRRLYRLACRAGESTLTVVCDDVIQHFEWDIVSSCRTSPFFLFFRLKSLSKGLGGELLIHSA
jgi:hypothetical protein